MTTVFEAKGLVGRRTHVLIIGVGKYTYGIGGADQKPETFGLMQLTSPPVSAKALIAWFLGPQFEPQRPGFSNPSAPLASLEALISEDGPVRVEIPGGERELDPAKAANVKTAFNRWRARVQADQGSTAILYFCGHGQSTGRQYAFFEDVLEQDGREFENGFDVEATLYSLRTVAQDSQIHFWIDSCREVSAAMLLQPDACPRPLFSASLIRPVIAKAMSLLYAAGAGQIAFSKEGQVSRFTTALIKSLSGCAGTRRSGAPIWEVKPGELGRAVGLLLDAENRTAARRQSSASTTDAECDSIVEMTQAPTATVSLDLVPEHLRANSEVFLRGQTGLITRHCGNGPVSVDVPKGYYDIGARSTAAAFADKLLQGEDIVPPVYAHTFEVV